MAGGVRGLGGGGLHKIYGAFVTKGQARNVEFQWSYGKEFQIQVLILSTEATPLKNKCHFLHPLTFGGNKCPYLPILKLHPGPKHPSFFVGDKE